MVADHCKLFTGSPPPNSTDSRPLLDHITDFLTDHSAHGVITNEQNARTLAALHACMAPGASIDNQPVPQDPAAFAPLFEQVPSSTFLKHTRGVFHQPSDNHFSTPTCETHVFDLRVSHYSRLLATTTLARDNPARPWRIATITNELGNSS